MADPGRDNEGTIIPIVPFAVITPLAFLWIMFARSSLTPVRHRPAEGFPPVVHAINAAGTFR